MYSGIGDRGFTNDSKLPRCSPLLTLTAPISVIAAPFFGEAPVVPNQLLQMSYPRGQWQLNPRVQA